MDRRDRHKVHALHNVLQELMEIRSEGILLNAVEVVLLVDTPTQDGRVAWIAHQVNMVRAKRCHLQNVMVVVTQVHQTEKAGQHEETVLAVVTAVAQKEGILMLVGVGAKNVPPVDTLIERDHLLLTVKVLAKQATMARRKDKKRKHVMVLALQGGMETGKVLNQIYVALNALQEHTDQKREKYLRDVRVTVQGESIATRTGVSVSTNAKIV